MAIQLCSTNIIIYEIFSVLANLKLSSFVLLDLNDIYKKENNKFIIKFKNEDNIEDNDNENIQKLNIKANLLFYNLLTDKFDNINNQHMNIIDISISTLFTKKLQKKYFYFIKEDNILLNILYNENFIMQLPNIDITNFSTIIRTNINIDKLYYNLICIPQYLLDSYKDYYKNVIIYFTFESKNMVNKHYIIQLLTEIQNKYNDYLYIDISKSKLIGRRSLNSIEIYIKYEYFINLLKAGIIYYLVNEL